jgi:hypothetical protein
LLPTTFVATEARGALSYSFKIGVEYLVFAKANYLYRYFVNAYTAPVEEATEHLKFLAHPEKVYPEVKRTKGAR